MGKIGKEDTILMVLKGFEFQRGKQTPENSIWVCRKKSWTDGRLILCAASSGFKTWPDCYEIPGNPSRSVASTLVNIIPTGWTVQCHRELLMYNK